MFLLHNVLEAYEPVDVGWICLIPPLLTMIIALSSKEVVISLLIGVIVATLIYVIKSRRPFVQIIEVFFSILTSRTAVNMEICLFTFMMGGLVKLMELSGGTAAFCRWFGRLVKSRKITQLVAIILSFFLFLDDYFNIITSSAIMYAVFDQNHVSKPKAAYVVHTMASNLCILIPITSWAAVVIAQIEECGIKDSFSMYSRSLLLNSYPVCSVLGVLLSSLTGVEIGGMKEYEKEARSPATLEKELLPEETESKGRLVDLLLPIATLILSTVLFIVYLGGGFEGHKSLQQVFTDSDTATALMFGSFMAILVSFLLYIPRRLMTFRDFVEALKEGMKVMIDTLLILVLAWTVGASTALSSGLGSTWETSSRAAICPCGSSPPSSSWWGRCSPSRLAPRGQASPCSSPSWSASAPKPIAPCWCLASPPACQGPCLETTSPRFATTPSWWAPVCTVTLLCM